MRRGLRQGFSTGACATALAVAAWKSQRTGADLTSVDILFPDGQCRALALAPAALLGAEMTAEGWLGLVKDAGDDPDCTHGAVFYARLRPCDPALYAAALDPAASTPDLPLAVGEGRVLLRAVEGIGRCTRPGLDCRPGRWAVNTGPQAMLVRNLERAGLTGCWLFELGIRHGETLARSTLNARLGVLGGLSILGSSGLVRPYSHEAHMETVRLCLASHRALGGDEVLLCTGGRTEKGMRALLTDRGTLPRAADSAFVCMGDFIAASLIAAQKQGFARVGVACMPGKLAKYATGAANTHACRAGQDMDFVRRELAALDDGATATGEPASPDVLHACASVRELLCRVPADLGTALLQRLHALALDALRAHAPTLAVRLWVFDAEGRLLLDDTGRALPTGRGETA